LTTEQSSQNWLLIELKASFESYINYIDKANKGRDSNQKFPKIRPWNVDMLKRIFTGALLSLSMCTFAIAEPDIEVVSQMPSAAGFIMQSPSADCRYDFDYATVMRSIDGSFGLFRKAGKQRISEYTCQIRIDNTKILSEIAYWGGQTLTSVMNYARCDLHIATNAGAATYIYDMIPTFSTSNNGIVQYKVTNFTNIPNNQWISSVGFVCDATDDISVASVMGIGVKYQ